MRQGTRSKKNGYTFTLGSSCFLSSSSCSILDCPKVASNVCGFFGQKECTILHTSWPCQASTPQRASHLRKDRLKARDSADVLSRRGCHPRWTGRLPESGHETTPPRRGCCSHCGVSALPLDIQSRETRVSSCPGRNPHDQG